LPYLIFNKIRSLAFIKARYYSSAHISHVPQKNELLFWLNVGFAFPILFLIRYFKNYFYPRYQYLSSRPAEGPSKPPTQWVPGLFPGNKTAGAWINHSPLSSTEVNGYRFTSTPPVSLHGLDRENVTFFPPSLLGC
jgi:hypothetical protein